MKKLLLAQDHVRIAQLVVQAQGRPGGLNAGICHGEALKDLTTSGGDLRDRGWHFRVSYQLP